MKKRTCSVVLSKAFLKLTRTASRSKAKTSQVSCVPFPASHLRLAKQLALTHHDRVRVFIDLDQRELVTQFVQTGLTHHVYRYSDKQVVIEEPSGGAEILFHPSGRSATATTIYLHGQVGPNQKLTVSITGRVSIL